MNTKRQTHLFAGINRNLKQTANAFSDKIAIKNVVSSS